ncbi:MAG: hypothetical protein ACREXY_10245, partial [Gammaproteobacteria bacterium]
PPGFGPHWLVRSQMRNQGDVVTFYSYKGGTGRSMALVNCAGLIAQHLPDKTKPILLIDFDLEAPGLHRYLEPYLPPKDEWAERPGTLELFEALSDAVERCLAARANSRKGTSPVSMMNRPPRLLTKPICQPTC